MHQVSELLSLSSLLSPAERELQRCVREFVDKHVRVNIAQWYENAHFPQELVAQMGALGLLGMHLDGYGCPGRSAVEYGLAALELEAGDSGLRTFVSVQGSLAMTAIHKHGSEEQKQHWLPRMARGEAIGCFALTEAGAGSDPASMTTIAYQVDGGTDWILSGTKRWIGMASIADVAVVWAKTEDGVRGFLVPTDAAGFTATPIQAKLSLRVSIQCDIELKNVRLPATALLPHAQGLRGPFECLNEARYGIIWGAMGAARDALACALDYAQQRQQFQRPLAGFQLTQQKLVNMSMELEKGMLLAHHLGRLKDQGSIGPHQISFGKLNNCREAIKICREARTILGGNGITLDYSPFRHANNLESVLTYEGTEEMHMLILGQEITGIPAFR